MSEQKDPFNEPFGTLFGDWISIATYQQKKYHYSGSPKKLEQFSLHPGSHAFHYNSTCFEGLKVHKQADGKQAIFRLKDHVSRMQQSLQQLQVLPPETELLERLIIDAAEANSRHTPDAPGSLYIRPAFMGTMENVGAAAAPTDSGQIYVITSPVGDYFKGGIRPLSLYVEESLPRTTPQFGKIKSGANYAMALGPTLLAKEKYQVDQVLFATNNDVTETGASNFFLADDKTLVTRHLDESFLHGITRASILSLARDLGYEIQEKTITIEDLKKWRGEAFLTGTAAVIAPVGRLVFSDGETHTFDTGEPGPTTLRLRNTLLAIQQGKAPDTHQWLTPLTTTDTSS